MDWNTYRKEFAAYRSALAQAHYRAYTGLPAMQPLAALHERYSVLFRPESITELEQIGSAFFTDTERRSAQALRDALRCDYLESATREVDLELARRESSLRLEWQGKLVTRQNFLTILTEEQKAPLRQDLVARWSELMQHGDDLRAERLRLRNQAAQTLGFAGERALYEAVTNLDLASLGRDAESFLQQTGSFYYATLNDQAAQLWPGAHREQLTYADWLYWRHQAQPHPFFPAHDLLPAYRDVLRGFGWHAGTPPHLHNATHAAPACFAVQPPHEVYVTYPSCDGVSSYRDFFTAAGRAQHHVWTSRALLARHPAFVFAPDQALNEGYAALFRAFFCDAAWLCEYRAGLGPAVARALARHEAWLILAQARRDCALLVYELATHEKHEPGSETAQELYCAGLFQATGFRHETALAWAATTTPWACVQRLRGLLLAASVSEYLRVRYGRRWWATRRAGDELADWWNTGSRYQVEEFASLTGAGPLSFDWLAEECLRAGKQ